MEADERMHGHEVREVKRQHQSVFGFISSISGQASINEANVLGHDRWPQKRKRGAGQAACQKVVNPGVVSENVDLAKSEVRHGRRGTSVERQESGRFFHHSSFSVSELSLTSHCGHSPLLALKQFNALEDQTKCRWVVRKASAAAGLCYSAAELCKLREFPLRELDGKLSRELSQFPFAIFNIHSENGLNGGIDETNHPCTVLYAPADHFINKYLRQLLADSSS